MLNMTTEARYSEESLNYYSSAKDSLTTEEISATSLNNVLDVPLSFTSPIESAGCTWVSREESKDIAPSRSKERKLLDSINGTLLEISDYGVVCEFQIENKIKKLELQRKLFDSDIHIGDLIELSMNKDDGFLKPLITITKPVFDSVSDKSSLADQILDSF